MPAAPTAGRAVEAAAGDDHDAMRDLRDDVLARGAELGLDAVGVTTAEPFADTRRTLDQRKAQGLHGGMAFTYRNPARSTEPQRSLDGAKAIVVAARSYRREPPPAAANEPVPPTARVARYSWEDHYAHLRDALARIGERLAADGWRSKVVVDDNALVDRAAAHRAGIGWYGKNTNLLLPNAGSWFVLGSLVTDAPLPPTALEPIGEGCGACDRCLVSCPTGALVAPGVLDARRCLAWLLQATGAFPREYREALGGRIYGCDDCQEVCPPNRMLDRKLPPPRASADAQPWVDLVAMLAMGDDELLATFGRWYVPRREARYLRRNALVALGNVGDARDGRVVAAVAAALAHDDPLVRAHAVWAAARLGRHDLLTAVEADRSSEVAAELCALPPSRTR
ncbi:MAG TPA: tRNA epoxyqueuosine(34) reductase QueG [Acidimicrobiales bacterium]